MKYVLREDVREACMRILRCWPDLLDPMDPSLRMPGGAIWIEWSEFDRSRPDRRKQMGALVQAESCGRRGRIRSFWEDEQFGVEMSQATLLFDFDGLVQAPDQGEDHFDPVHSAPCDTQLAGCSVVSLCPAWSEYFRHTDARFDRSRGYLSIAEQLTDILPFLLSFLRLLQRPANVDSLPVHRGKLNRSRRAAGRPELVDHVELTLSAGRSATGTDTSDWQRRAVRQHFVRGHLVRRAGGVFWRSAHLRGDPKLSSGAFKTHRMTLGKNREISRDEFTINPMGIDKSSTFSRTSVPLGG